MDGASVFNFGKLSKNYAKFFQELRAGKSCSVFGVQNSMRPAIVDAIGKKAMYITADMVKANALAEEFKLMGKRAVVLQNPSVSLLYSKAQSRELYLGRLNALSSVLSGNFDELIIPVSGLFNFLPNVNKFSESTLNFSVGQNYEPSEIEKLLVMAGYHREDLIFEAGQFSRRGEILDIFPVNHDTPFRIDFFDTEIESIKVFDITTQKGTKAMQNLMVCPCSDLMMTENEINFLLAELKKQIKQDTNENVILLNSQIEEVLQRLGMGEQDFTLDILSCYLASLRSNIFDYLRASNEDFVVVFDECKQVYDYLINFGKELQARVKQLQADKMLFSGKHECCFSVESILENIKKCTCLAFMKITNSNRFFDSDAVFSFKTVPVSRYTHSLRDFALEVKLQHKRGNAVIIFGGTPAQAKTLVSSLATHGIKMPIKSGENLFDGKSGIVERGYSSGFMLPDEKIMVVGTYDVLTKKRATNTLSAGRENTFSVPKVGDYVVHHFYGIGICEGVTQLSGTLGTQDYVVIRYRDDDKLYVPTSQMDILDRFSGAEAPKRLSKIGGQDFSAVKEKVKQSVKKLAINLIELYAKREQIKGFAFSEDNDLQREFENSFPFTETEDQLLSADEIKKDMEQPKVMDRLLCGDVGFGKTEVALRAAFKAIVDGKQVAFIAPTTILSEQHFNTARSRMYDFGVQIAVLNRFKSQAETEKILSGISDGTIDLVCGTHRVLSKDVEFKNLGLIVLDEEQKFGVEDKEKLKTRYPSVDVLTLSATPIPRTLSMSLSGIRDISIISTPPSERLPIQTFVTEFSTGLIKDAITRELERDGQVFVLFNSVEKIYTFAEKIRVLVPDAKVTVAHGQMPSKQLEEVVFDFYNKKSNVLVCTTIIENGIDIENANTLIVIDADKLGLSQLYQIRGRVGRGARLAYAYFTYDKSKMLTEEAYKRLDAISEFCEFGSGFKLAMRDLEIRGGGNILGAEQSGHLQKIGFDLYSKLLSDAVKEIKGEKVEEQTDVLVKVALDAFIPETYISTSEDRMIAYKRISSVQDEDMAQKLTLELVSTYGKVPSVVENLISISLVRQLAGKLHASMVESVGSEVHLIFSKSEQITNDANLAEAIFRFKEGANIELAGKPKVKFNRGKNVQENFAMLKKFLSECILLSQSEHFGSKS